MCGCVGVCVCIKELKKISNTLHVNTRDILHSHPSIKWASNWIPNMPLRCPSSSLCDEYSLLLNRLYHFFSKLQLCFTSWQFMPANPTYNLKKKLCAKSSLLPIKDWSCSIIKHTYQKLYQYIIIVLHTLPTMFAYITHNTIFIKLRHSLVSN